MCLRRVGLRVCNFCSNHFRFFIQLSSGLQWCVWKEGVTHNVSCTDLAVINYIALSEHTVTSDDDLAVFAGTIASLHAHNFLANSST